MTAYAKEKRSVIAAVTAAMKADELPRPSDHALGILASQVGACLEAGYDLGDIRFAAVHLSYANEPWDLCASVRDSFEAHNLRGLPADSRTRKGESSAHIYNSTSATGGGPDA